MAAERGSLSNGSTAPQAVLFDWDNTLVDNWASVQDALNVTLAAMGMEPWSEAEVRARVRGSSRDTFPAMFGARAEEASRIFYRRFEQAHQSGLRPLTGASGLLRSLSDGGYYLGVVSNKRGDFLRAQVRRLGWEHRFARVIGANDADEDKPSAAPIHLALAGSGIAAGPEVWYVGDALIDIECARNAGCKAVLVGDGHGAETVDADPDIRAVDLTTLAKLFATP